MEVPNPLLNEAARSVVFVFSALSCWYAYGFYLAMRMCVVAVPSPHVSIGRAPEQ
jgi:hypothetical protein